MNQLFMLRSMERNVVNFRRRDLESRLRSRSWLI